MEHSLHRPNPWYRERWPWILMAGPAAVVVAGFITLYLAVSGADGVVADSYYKDGLAINRLLERDHAARDGGYEASLMLNHDRSRVRILLRGRGALPERLHVRFVHPTQSDQDREIVARRAPGGMYDAAVQLPKASRWDVQLEDDAHRWRLTGRWQSGQRADTMVLAPRER